MTKRKDPNLTEKLAAALLMLFPDAIPRGRAQEMTAEKILAFFEWDHEVHFSVARDLGWPPSRYNHPSRLTPRLPADHAEKTNKRDKPAIAKSKRLTKKRGEFQGRILMKGQADPAADGIYVVSRPKRKIPSRPMPKGKRPIPSRKFNQRRSR